MKRQEVYQVIDSERDYQDLKWNHIDNENDQFKSVGDFITYIDYYLTKAKEAYTTNSGDKDALDALRKVSGLTIACFEIHGVSERKNG